MKIKTIYMIIAICFLSVNIGGTKTFAASNLNKKKDAFKNALLANNGTAKMYDGNKLKFQDEKDTLIFEDDFSSGNFSKWSANSNVSLVKDGIRNAAVFTKGSELDLSTFKEMNKPGYYRVAFDINYKNVKSNEDLGRFDYYWGGIIEYNESMMPIKQGTWQTNSEVFVKADSNMERNLLKIKGAVSLANPQAQMMLTNFKIYRVDPTYNVDFSQGKMDPRFATNPKFQYSFVNKGNQKVLQVKMPANSLPVLNKEGTNYADVLQAKETLKPVSIYPNGSFQQEGMTISSNATVKDFDIEHEFMVGALEEDQLGYYSRGGYGSSGFFTPGAFNFISADDPDMFVNGGTSGNDQVKFGISAGRDSADMKNPTTLFLKGLQEYKGISWEGKLDNSPRKLVKVEKTKIDF